MGGGGADLERQYLKIKKSMIAQPMGPDTAMSIMSFAEFDSGHTSVQGGWAAGI